MRRMPRILENQGLTESIKFRKTSEMVKKNKRRKDSQRRSKALRDMELTR